MNAAACLIVASGPTVYGVSMTTLSARLTRRTSAT